jgi:hypothetical protein
MATKKPLALYAGRMKELATADSVSIQWSWVGGAPTTLAGYGITDAVNNFGAQSIAGAKQFNGAVLLTGSSGVKQANPKWEYQTETATRRWRNIYNATDATDGTFSWDKWNGSTWVTIASFDTSASNLFIGANAVWHAGNLTPYTDSAARAAVITTAITNGDTTHSPSGDAVFDALALKLDTALGINIVTSAPYTLVMSDANKSVRMNIASANVCTFPPNSDVPFPIGTEIWVEQANTGTTTVLPGAGVTFRGAGAAYSPSAQYGVVCFLKTNTDTWTVISRTSIPETDSEWNAPTLLNSWVNFGAGFDTAAYRKVNNQVMLRGVIKSGTTTSGTVLFTLPAGFFPSSHRVFAALSGASMVRVDVRSTGDVQLGGAASAVFLTLDGISFFI